MNVAVLCERIYVSFLMFMACYARFGVQVAFTASGEFSDASVGEIASPVFTYPLKDVNVKSGQRVCLQCRVSGHPLPEVCWFKDNKLLGSSSDFQVIGVCKSCIFFFHMFRDSFLLHLFFLRYCIKMCFLFDSSML